MILTLQHRFDMSTSCFGPSRVQKHSGRHTLDDFVLPTPSPKGLS